MRLPTAIIWCLGLCIVVSGCRSEDSGVEPASQNSRSSPKVAVIPGLKLADLQAALGADYVAQPASTPSKVKVVGIDAGTPVSFVRTTDTHKIQVTAIEDAASNIRGVSAHVIGPQAGSKQSIELMREVAITLVAALGVPPTGPFSDHLDIASIRARLGADSTVRLGELLLLWLPNKELSEQNSLVPFTPGMVEQQFRISPAVGSPGPSPKAIPGATVAQLESLLEGFSLKAKVDSEILLYLHELDTHEELVQCSLNAAGDITGIEAFVGNLAEGMDIMKLSEELWIKLAHLQYKDSNPEKIIAFIVGPKLEYAVGVGEEVANVSFFLPVGGDGRRTRLTIWTIP